MCGRYASYLSAAAIRALFSTVNATPNVPPSWNVAPTQAAMVVRRQPDTGERHLDLLRWGLVPHFTKDLKTARKPINAWCETAASSGMFRGALAQRRCLVPVEALGWPCRTASGPTLSSGPTARRWVATASIGVKAGPRLNKRKK